MRFTLCFTLCVTLVAAAQDVTVQPFTFPLSNLVDFNAGRGGPEYSYEILGSQNTENGIEYLLITYKFTHVATGYVVVEGTGSGAFKAWNNALSQPFYGVLKAAVTTDRGQIQLSSLGLWPKAFATYTHTLQVGQTSTVTFTAFEASISETTAMPPAQPISFPLTVINTKPTIALQVSPSKIAPGGTVAVIPTVSDPDNHPVSVSYAYGDGSTGTEAFHTYAAAGVYTLTASAFDGFDTVTTSIDIEVVGDAQRVPVPRFTTSDVVGFVGVPLAFDASFTTDPQNAIASYSWNFGDSSPAGSGQVVSRTYTQEGSYLVTLTVVDGEGIQATTARAIEILPAELLGTFNAGVEFTAVFDRNKQSKDTLTLKATLNTGDTLVGDGTAVTLAIVGQQFSATLDRKLRAAVNVVNAPKISIKAKAGVRKQAAGQVDITISVKNAALGLGFNQAGVLSDNDDLVEVTVPIRIDIGAKSFEVQTDAVFKFNRTGTRAKGEGQSE